MSSVVRCLAAATLLAVAGGCGSDGDAGEGESSADPDPVEAAVEIDDTTATAEAVGDSDLAREVSKVLCEEESYYCGIDGLEVQRKADTMGVLVVDYVFTDGEYECTERTDFQEFDDGSLDILSYGYEWDCGDQKPHPRSAPPEAAFIAAMEDVADLTGLKAHRTDGWIAWQGCRGGDEALADGAVQVVLSDLQNTNDTGSAVWFASVSDAQNYFDHIVEIEAPTTCDGAKAGSSVVVDAVELVSQQVVAVTVGDGSWTGVYHLVENVVFQVPNAEDATEVRALVTPQR